jgi:tRNA A58 N-methylase Trm61
MSDEHVCPWWLGYLLASPLRRLGQNPDRILAPYVKEGMIVLDVGPGMGFFTLPMARIVGETGKVISVDLQEKMLNSLRRRAARAGLADRIETRVCTSDSLEIADLAERLDFALAFAVMHEMPHPESAIPAITKSLKIGGVLLIAEPTGHVSKDEFQKTISLAANAGCQLVETPTIRKSHSAVLRKTAK